MKSIISTEIEWSGLCIFFKKLDKIGRVFKTSFITDLFDTERSVHQKPFDL
jgi:hypothetical protein